MTAITVEDIGVSFGNRVILENISFSLEENDRLGIVGVNGCGKSTLFRLITGELSPDGGAVYISKEKSVGILRQNDAFLDEYDGEEASAIEVMYRSFPHLLKAEKRLFELEALLDGGEEKILAEYTALHEKFIADGGLEFRGRCASTLLKMGFDAEAQQRAVSSFSGGQRTRLSLCRELCREPDILMLDEPTNHLDTETLTWLEGFLSGYKKCLMVISHDRYFLDRVTNKTLFLEYGKGKLYAGGYSKSSAQRKIDREIAEKHYKTQQKEIARQEAYIAQQRAWNRERNIIAAESRLKQLAKMEKLEKPKEGPKGVRIKFSSSPASGNDVLYVRNLGFSFPDGKKLFGGLEFTVKRNDRLFFVGPNGCGKSTLIKLLLGRLSASEGYAEFGYNVVLGYYDQENQNLCSENSVLEELWREYPSKNEVEIRSALALFRFIGEDVYKSVGDLSGGERARLTLAKLIMSDTNLLLLDEPTNHLDIDSREALEEALEEYDGTIIIVSHDRYFIEKLATRFIDLSDGRFYDIPLMQSGNGYDELCRERERRSVAGVSAAKAEPKEITSGKEQYLKNKKEAADRRNAQKRLERLEAEAGALEKELEEIDALMNGEAAYDYKKLSELDLRKNELEERLLEIYEEI